ncbi:hypothetical protein [Bacillus suaedaesalsae]|uniref:Group-specific protein n=1 Tax=Bacillus suaedaesalsae TaxID=2810349 RepID=A0ABS2DLR1_9BACI|nr:hypothetical protein [Bacillus suaedaesalsae]MBM6619332.1 hypothetical protein [Bacillus suaedaesalsae]
MFDPTIFDNLKIIIEGAVYDRDLDGDWLVIDRKDIVDLATMSRQFSVSFQLLEKEHLSCTWFLASSVEQLASELTNREETLHGCSTWLEFLIQLEDEKVDIEQIYKIISRKWENREILCTNLQTYPATNSSTLKVEVRFNRVIREEDIDDLQEMLNYMEETLHALHENS